MTNAVKVVCLTPTFGSTTPEAERLLSGVGAALSRVDPSDAAAVPRELRDAFALIVGTQTVDRGLLSQAPSLRIVAKHGTGIDNIDVQAASDRRVVVTNTPHANSLAVAEFTIGLMLALARGIVRSDRAIRQREWSIHIGRQLAGATLGIVGMGSVGQLVGARAAALGMLVLFNDEVLPPEAEIAESWESVSLGELLDRSDVVTIHVPLTPATANLIDGAALGRMKRTAFLINAARGGIVDEAAIADALARGRMAGAALDVFSEEPPTTDLLLLREEQTVLTPHTAGYTEEALAAMSVAVSENIIAVLQGREPPGAVSPFPGSTA